MLVKDLENIFHETLDVIYGKEEVSSFFFLCTEAFYNISRLDIALNRKISITKEEQQPIFNALEALKKEQPIQYILGETEFFGLPFKVNENTLIPRPETEELVQLIIDSKKSKTSTQLSILDIGTGSGCIAIALAKNLNNAQLYALDVSEKAIEKAKENATLNNVDINFLEGSILKDDDCNTLFKNLEFNIIVSNPPYVRNLEKVEIQNNVLNNEPHLALFVEDNDPLIFYRAITKFAKNKLKQNGQLFFEINEYLGEETKDLVESFGFKNVEILKDIFNKNRMLKANI
ncbi:peptide chain release factor N(5)-glutamine methyltransferase [Lacinutrix venerupis]|uniref:Release factor glutamine methyltransferase n=1 Tax=Lacinutrix venerupis TaxID=1486034 RepID=A0AAC9PX10_9FLAO|nr:peptide chain release factor N(5)-glutamine methyltransferase [Lacinutrix venerupis]APY00656.1 protein-(glutamine-N5) methyltransferase, release factor-specific [Lacinutrix venerupis]